MIGFRFHDNVSWTTVMPNTAYRAALLPSWIASVGAEKGWVVKGTTGTGQCFRNHSIFIAFPALHPMGETKLLTFIWST